MMPAALSLRAAGADLTTGWHACAFFDGQDEEDATLLPFARHCVQCGEKSVQLLDPARQQERLDRLRQAGLDVERARASGQLDVRPWEDTYLRDGRFDGDRMLALVSQILRDAHPAFSRTRVWANMEWSGSGLPGCDHLIEYESRVNAIVDQSRDIVVCVYDVRKYSASLVMDVLRTHPMVVVGTSLQANPLFVPTEQFLADYRQRLQARRGVRPGTAD